MERRRPRRAPAALILAVLVLGNSPRGSGDRRPLPPAPTDIVRAAVDACASPPYLADGPGDARGFSWPWGGMALGFAIDRWTLARNALPALITSQTICRGHRPAPGHRFGTASGPAILVVGLICFFPIAVSTADGLRAADGDDRPVAHDGARRATCSPRCSLGRCRSLSGVRIISPTAWWGHPRSRGASRGWGCSCRARELVSHRLGVRLHRHHVADLHRALAR